MENDLYELVQKAQDGDKEAMQSILSMFMPVIRSAKYKMKQDRQDDLEQSIIERIINKVQGYDMSKNPDFTSFCRNLSDSF
ncbi:helix-turn-helix domain-containing protein [Cohnella sp. AR92]|uniref:helix-turn-helix domain-containing protein n=1 Tax=Cohnella sp. AR92 TaxID=648716 RepID=UPI000F8C9CFB|nr:helix-turn-helix domain-containing protein [Cohnella sp. AR92]RUS46740.1 helix-turn-helix domain-containing protein [Cohnella sp. AR92]